MAAISLARASHPLLKRHYEPAHPNFASRQIIVLSVAGCSSSDDDSNVVTGPVGGAVLGAVDDHCEGQPVVESDPAVCMTPGTNDDDAAAGASGDDDSAGGATGTVDCTSAHDADYGATLYNASGSDDDCKYDVSWTSTPIRKGQGVTFTVTASSKANGAPLERIDAQPAGELALSRVEPYVPCDPTHFPPAGDLNAKISETSPGVYTVGPIVFDESGRWVVRFHFYESCFDSETSPHGHAAFFIDVP